MNPFSESVVRTSKSSRKRKFEGGGGGRSFVACYPCRKRKQKCDEARPCTRCVSRGCEEACLNAQSPSRFKLHEEQEQQQDEEVDELSLPGKLRTRRKTLMSDLEVAILPVDMSETRELLLESRVQDGNPLTWSSAIAHFWRSARWNLIRLSAMCLPQTYLTSLWVEPLPKEVVEAAMKFPTKFSGTFFADFLMQQPLSWKWFLHSLEFILDSPTTKLLHDRIIQRAIDDAEVDELSRDMLLAMKTFPGLNRPTLVFMKGSRFKMTREENEIICSLFNVNSIEDSDVAIYQIREFFDAETMSFKILVELNEGMERILNLQAKDFAETIHAGRGLFRVGPLFWSYEKSFWPTITDFLLGSVFREPVFMTQIVNMMTCEGKAVPSLIHAFASFDSEFGVRTSTTVCHKPLSRTFKPVIDVISKHDEF
jgi:hypothetical protein